MRMTNRKLPNQQFTAHLRKERHFECSRNCQFHRKKNYISMYIHQIYNLQYIEKNNVLVTANKDLEKNFEK